MSARCRLTFVAVALVVAVTGAGCASGGRPVGPDGGPRRDAPGMVPDAPGLDAPALDVSLAPDTPDRPDVANVDTGRVFVGDAGTDAPPAPGTDAGPPPECTTAADCSDGEPCNGIERCELGMCTPGITVTCDDGVSCTTDGCSGG